MDWLTPLTGLVGAVVGAAASYAGTHQAQVRAIADAKQARLETKQDAAVAVLAATFAALHRHIRSVPDPRRREADGITHAQLAAAEEEWERGLGELLAPVRIAIEAIRHEELRSRLREIFDLLEGWDYELEYAYFRRPREWVLGGLVDQAVAFVGAWQREDAFPEPNLWLREARSSLRHREEERQYAREAEEAERRERTEGSAETP